MINKLSYKENGSVTLIVGVTIIFILVTLSISLATVSIKRRSQLMESKKLQEIYGGDIDEVYDELVEKQKYMGME